MRVIIVLAIVILMACSALADDISGKYCVVSESEWGQCIIIKKKGNTCTIITENWLAGKYKTTKERKVIPCRYHALGDRLRVEYDNSVDFLDYGIYDWKEFGWKGCSIGLKRVGPAHKESRLHPLIYWKEPIEKHKQRCCP